MNFRTEAVDLVEFQSTGGLSLDGMHIDAVGASAAQIRIQPDPRARGKWILTPSSRIGTIALDGLTIRIWPKIPITALFRMLSVSTVGVTWGTHAVENAESLQLEDFIAHALVDAIDAAMPSGLLKGYVSAEEESHCARGRADLVQTVRRQPLLRLPLTQQVEFHDCDIAENQLIAAALASLAPRVSADATRARIGATRRHFGEVRVPARRDGALRVSRNRLNARWWHAIELSQLVLRAAGLELGAGSHRSREFIVDMNVVFERFVRGVLARALAARGIELTSPRNELWLDADRTHSLNPDLAVRSRERCAFIGDCKYKLTDSAAALQSDLYQMLAYATAAGLEDAMLIYCASDSMTRARDEFIGRADARVRVRVRALQPDLGVDALERQLLKIAGEIEACVGSRK